MLQFEAVDAQTRQRLLGPMGWLVFFAMHPTVVGSRNRLFGGDAFGVTSRLLEAELRRAWVDRCAGQDCVRPNGLDPVAAVLQTNAGDIAAVWSSGAPPEAVRVGRTIAERAWATYADDPALLRVRSGASASDAGFRTSLVLDSRYLEAELPDAPVRPGSSERLCSSAELGAAAGRGASDHPTSLSSLFPTESDSDRGRSDCQSPKKKMMGFLQRLLVGSPRESFPTHAPVALLRVDDTWLSFVPCEPTVQAGEEINRRVRGVANGLDGRPAHALVVGLANAYFQYLTTREEYAVQNYEGASTLYGPASTEYFAERFFLLARSMTGADVDARLGEAVAFEYDRGPVRSRLPDANDTPSLASLGAARRAWGLCRLPQRPPAGICFWWTDGSPARVGISDKPWLALASKSSNEPVRACHSQRPLPSPWEARCDPGALIDDRGLAFQTRVRRRDGDGWLWSTLFHASPEQWSSIAEAGPVQIVARGPDGANGVRSDAFGATALPPACSADAVRFCLGDGEWEDH